MGGGGTISGGGPDIPAYLQDAHVALINQSDDGHMPLNSMMDILDITFNDNPYSGTIVYNPGNKLTQTSNAVNVVQALINNMNHLSDYNSAINAGVIDVDVHMNDGYLNTLIPEINISIDTLNSEVLAFRNIQQDKFENEIFSNFRFKMLQINAIQNSSFVLGDFILRGFNERDTARYNANLRLKLYLSTNELNSKFLFQRQEEIQKHFLHRGEFLRDSVREILLGLYNERNLWVLTLMHTIKEKALHVITKMEEVQGQLDFDDSNSSWNINLFAQPGNLLASVSGGVTALIRTPNRAMSALAGALSGAATGAMISPDPYGIGPGVGAILGGIAGWYLAIPTVVSPARPRQSA